MVTTNAGSAAASPGISSLRPGMVWIPGGAFRMGSEDFYPEERPVREVRVDDFWIDRHPVTNDQFASFVAATGYVTIAEQPLDPALYPGAPAEDLAAGSMVFTPTSGPVDLRNAADWWSRMPGADWREPSAAGSASDGLDEHPVVEVALADAEACCASFAAALPTEVE